MGFVQEMRESDDDAFAGQKNRACHPVEDRPGSVTALYDRRLRSGDSRLQHVGRLGPFGSLHDVELDVLDFLQRLEALPLQGRIVHEDVLAAVESDESEPFPIVEPLDRPFCLHKTPPFLIDHAQLRSRPKKPYRIWERMNAKKKDTDGTGELEGHLQEW